MRASVRVCVRACARLYVYVLRVRVCVPIHVKNERRVRGRCVCVCVVCVCVCARARARAWAVSVYSLFPHPSPFLPLASPRSPLSSLIAFPQPRRFLRQNLQIGPHYDFSHPVLVLLCR